MLDIRLFKKIGIIGLPHLTWVVKLTRLPVIPEPGSCLMVGPDETGHYVGFVVEHGDEWLIMRTGDPVVNLFLESSVTLPTDYRKDEDPGEEFRHEVEMHTKYGFKECRPPDFSSPKFQKIFKPPQEF